MYKKLLLLEMQRVHRKINKGGKNKKKKQNRRDFKTEIAVQDMTLN
jgi:hypothetical protein